MQDLNQVTLIGRVGVDPEGREVNGTTACNFRMATNRSWTDAQGQRKEVAHWHRIVCWNKTAELVQRYCKKGMLVYVTGALESREYEKNGEKRTMVEVRAHQVGFLSGDGQGQSHSHSERPPQRSQEQRPQISYSAPRQERAQRPAQNSSWGPAQGALGDDEVPF